MRHIREALSRHRQLLPALERALAQTRLVSEMEREPHPESEQLRRTLSEAMDRISRAIEPLTSIVSLRVARYLHVILSVYRKRVADNAASVAGVKSARRFLQRLV